MALLPARIRWARLSGSANGRQFHYLLLGDVKADSGPALAQRIRADPRLLRCHRLADLQGTASANERVALDQADCFVQVVGSDQRVPADGNAGTAVAHALGRYGLGSSEWSARVDHAVTYASDPGPKGGHHLFPGLG